MSPRPISRPPVRTVSVDVFAGEVEGVGFEGVGSPTIGAVGTTEDGAFFVSTVVVPVPSIICSLLISGVIGVTGVIPPGVLVFVDWLPLDGVKLGVAVVPPPGFVGEVCAKDCIEKKSEKIPTMARNELKNVIKVLFD
jgi:hypothetical protein